ncbi:MAG TPA: type II toxin-antitoxin system RelE/ParE family toxin [Pirellulales bacterium]|nr:type II toxin-antitoxin system RelE/ParE family toxin [Pirellulales bacterium]
MSQPTLDVHSAAADEIRRAKRWYAERSAKAKDRFVAELDAAMERVVAEPERWPAYLHKTQRCRLRDFPYMNMVVYRVVGPLIQVVAVAHTSRRPGYWRKRRLNES